MSTETAVTTIETLLENFVDKTGNPYKLGKQWGKDGWRIASDARVIVRIKTGEPDFHFIDEQQRHAKPPNAQAVFDPYGCDFEKTDLFLPINQLHCAACSNTGRVVGECPECDGSGTISCSKCGHDEDCELCDGSGSAEIECSKCENIKINETRLLDRKYWYLIETIPGIAILHQHNQSLFRFSIDGLVGQGIVMHKKVDGDWNYK